MARASKPNVPSKSPGSQHYATEVNATDTAIDAVIDDYLSQTDTTKQDMASDLDFATGKRPKLDFTLFNPTTVPSNVEGHLYYDSVAKKLKLYNGSSWLLIPGSAGGGGTSFEGTGSGTSPITIAHGLGDTPTKVFVSVNALQPYAVAYNMDATNVYVYHNAAGSLTVSVRAVL